MKKSIRLFEFSILSCSCLCLSIAPAYAKKTSLASFKTLGIDTKNEINSPSQLKRELNNDGLDIRSFLTVNSKTTHFDKQISQNVQLHNQEVTSYIIKKSSESNSKTGSKDIVSAAATIRTTIKYSTYTKSGGHTYGKLTSANGSITNFNSGFKFVKADILMASMGLGVVNQRKEFTTHNKTWSSSAPNSWVYTLMGNDWSAKGAKVTAYITRDGKKNYSGTYNLQVN